MGMIRIGKKTENAAQAAYVEEQRLQQERRIFGDVSNFEDGQLAPYEVWWSQHFNWLRERGYLLRPRYAPDWVPSWQGSKKNKLSCEDSWPANSASKILDATRLSDGAYVTLKIVRRPLHPYEVDIGQFFSSEPLKSDSANHCVPIYEVLAIPEEEDSAIIVMPLLREYVSPPFSTVGEAVECFRQLFEGLQFIHRHRVAHRDCTHLNVMMDAGRLCIGNFHPVKPLMNRDFSRFARFWTRTERPPKYYFIDFGLSRRYELSNVKPLEVPIRGGDKEVPEFQGSNGPCDPFPTDIFYLGNLIRKDFVETKRGFEFMLPIVSDMVQIDPSKRPTMDQVVERFQSIRMTLSPWKLRSRVVDKGEPMFTVVPRAVWHWVRQLTFIARRLPSVPSPRNT